MFVLGLHGDPGSGKSTIAKILTREFSGLFAECSFADPIKTWTSGLFGIPDAVLHGPSECRNIELTPKNFDGGSQEELESKAIAFCQNLFGYDEMSERWLASRTAFGHEAEASDYYTCVAELTNLVRNMHRRSFTPREALCAIGAFGRKYNPNIWINEWRDTLNNQGYAILDLGNKQLPLQLFIVTPDVRLPEEVMAVRQKSGIVVRVTRTGAKTPVSTDITETAIKASGISMDATIVNDGSEEDLAVKVFDLLQDTLADRTDQVSLRILQAINMKRSST